MIEYKHLQPTKLNKLQYDHTNKKNQLNDHLLRYV